MPTNDELNITVKLDTSAARRELEELRKYAMDALREILDSYAAAGLTPMQGTGSGSGGGGARRV